MLEKIDRKTMELVFHAVPDGIVIFDPRGRSMYWNGVAGNLLELTEGFSLSPEEWIKHFEIFLQDAKTPCSVRTFPLSRALTGESIDRTTLLLKNGRGGMRWVDMSARPLLDTLGYPIGAFMVIQDVTEKKRAELAALESQEMWRALVESSPEWIVNLDSNGTIVFSNKKMWGIEPQEFIGRPWLEFVKREFQPPMIEAMQSALQFMGQRALEIVLHSGPSIGWYSVSLGAIGKNGINSGLTLIVADITIRKQADAQQVISDRMASLGTLAAGIAHEINNPLAAVMSNLELAILDVKEAPIFEELKDLAEILDDAKDAATHLKNIVKDLRVFSRTDGNLIQPLEVTKVLESSIRMTKNEIRHRAELILDYQEVPRVMANESKLGQVFINLIMNAVQAIPEKKVRQNRITLRTYTSEHGVCVDIEDTGKGMDESILAKLFSPFFTTKAIGEGTGLGLSICHRIIQSIDGRISVKSEVGKGSTFTVWLRASKESEKDSSILESFPGEVVHRHILLVDDEILLAKSVQRVLTKYHEVSVANSVRRAFEILQGPEGIHIDLIVCDLMMPDGGGPDLHAKIASYMPNLARKMIFMTGGAFSPSAQRFLAEGKYRCLQKPFESQELFSAIDELMNDELAR